MKKRLFSLFLAAVFLLSFATQAQAQGYYFQLPQKIVHAYWNEDGTLSLDYTYVFQNDPNGHAIEYVDVGLPNGEFDESSITADVNGAPLNDISRSGFQGDGPNGVAVGLGSRSIPPGGRGTVHVYIGTVRDVLYNDDDDQNYASAVLIPNYFTSDVVYGISDTTVTFHLPPGIQTEEPRWHKAPSGFPSEPIAGIDNEGRIFYTWINRQASPSVRYEFGASFPKSYVPASAIARPDPFRFLKNIPEEALIPMCFFGFFGLIIAGSVFSDRNRRMKYLPPRIAIEGHGVKRGLTAVESAILLEQPLDKVMTMMLFGVVRKGAATVTSRDPLKIAVTSPLPGGMNDYETAFLSAMQIEQTAGRQNALKKMMIDLVKSLTEKMRGFSKKETEDYYKKIVERAWEMVKQAETPEVKSEKYDEVMEWTMLDKDYEDRTRDVFRSGPVYVPHWWGRYDPVFGRSTASSTPSVSTPSSSGGKVSLPTLPGGDFAASVVNGVQNFSAGVVGNLSSFTSGVTEKTNPVPVSTSSGGTRSGGGGGRSCACACACAGCACACAGGGR